MAIALCACGSNHLDPIREASGADAGGPLDGAPTVGDAATMQGDGGGRSCKRGMAANAAPSGAFFPAVTWWYDWSNQAQAAAQGIEFVPMIWGAGALRGPIPQGSTFILGFNEPNFKAQANLTPAQAAADWTSVEALASAQNIPLVSPAVNFCGSSSNTTGCSDPSITDPYTWLKDFFAACPGCRVDAIAVHWYNCDLPSLEAYLEGNGSLEGFVQFGKPIWLTEFSCDASKSMAEQKAYMLAAVPYLEASPHVARYSWFSATPIPNALLANPDGSLTDLGKTYASLSSSCP